MDRFRNLPPAAQRAYIAGIMANPAGGYDVSLDGETWSGYPVPGEPRSRERMVFLHEASRRQPVVLGGRRVKHWPDLDAFLGAPQPILEYAAWPCLARNDMRQWTQRSATTVPSLVVDGSWGQARSSSSAPLSSTPRLVAWEQPDGLTRIWTVGAFGGSAGSWPMKWREWDPASPSISPLADLQLTTQGSNSDGVMLMPSLEELWIGYYGDGFNSTGTLRRYDLANRGAFNLPQQIGSFWIAQPNPPNINIAAIWGPRWATLAGPSRDIVVPFNQFTTSGFRRYSTGDPEETNYGGSGKFYNNWSLDAGQVAAWLGAELLEFDAPWLTDLDGVWALTQYSPYDPQGNVVWHFRWLQDSGTTTKAQWMLAGMTPGAGAAWKQMWLDNNRVTIDANTTRPGSLGAGTPPNFPQVVLDDQGNAYGGFIDHGVRQLVSYGPGGSIRWAYPLGVPSNIQGYAVSQVLVFPDADRVMFVHANSGATASWITALTLGGAFVAIRQVEAGVDVNARYVGGAGWLYGPVDTISGRRGIWDMDLQLVTTGSGAQPYVREGMTIVAGDRIFSFTGGPTQGQTSHSLRSWA